MSKRALEVALKVYPIQGEWVGNQYGEWDEDKNQELRKAFQQGYEQSEKDTIERAESHLESVLLNFLDVDTVKWIIKDFKKAMEEE